MANLLVIAMATIFIMTPFMILLYVSWLQRYWKKRNIYTHSVRFMFGNARDFLFQRKSFGTMFSELYADAKAQNLPHAGFYFIAKAVYVPVHLKIIQRMLQQDFNYFSDRGLYFNEKHDPIGAHLFTLEGSKWRNLRAKLTPTFTSGRMKMNFPIIVRISHKLVDVIKKISCTREIEFKDLLARLTTDIIGTCAFGIECNSLDDPNAKFRRMGRFIFELTRWHNFMHFLSFLMPEFGRFFRIKGVREDVSTFFMGVIKETVEFRETYNVKRNDFLDLLIQLKNFGKLNDSNNFEESFDGITLTMEQIAGHAFVFFIGGFETSSTTMAFCLYELSLNQDVQQKLRQEVNEILNNFGELTYESLSNMVYMEMVINETLRKYPPVPVLNRKCTETYRVPNTDLIIEEGTSVIIPLQGIHYDQEYYPDPQRFDPERFSAENKKSIPPCAFLPFGVGPRTCVGIRFGLLQVKIGISMLLKSFKFKLNSTMSIPIAIDQTQFMNVPKGGVLLDIESI